MIGLRLRAAKKPPILSMFEIPMEEIEIEPEMIEPVTVADVEVVSIVPMVVPADAILPWDDDEPETPGKPPAHPLGDLPLFGVGWIDNKPGQQT